MMAWANSKNFGCIKEEKEPKMVSTNMYKYYWFIKGFRDHISEMGKYDESPHFFSGPNKEYEWSLDIFVEGDDRNVPNYISMRIHSFKRPVSVVENFAVQLSVLDRDDNKCVNKILFVKQAMEWNHFMIRKDLLDNPKLLPNDELIILCALFDLTSMNEQIEEHYSRNLLKTLYVNRKFSDFKFVVKGKEFNVHRAILATQSPVFETMFECNMREANEGKVDIDDVKPEVMEQLLNYIYTGEMDFEDFPDKMLVVAEKYQVEPLKFHCENMLVKKLSIDNIYDILVLSDQNNTTYLKEETIKFFHYNLKLLGKSEHFKTSVDALPGNLKTEIICFNALHIK